MKEAKKKNICALAVMAFEKESGILCIPRNPYIILILYKTLNKYT